MRIFKEFITVYLLLLASFILTFMSSIDQNKLSNTIKSQQEVIKTLQSKVDMLELEKEEIANAVDKNIMDIFVLKTASGIVLTDEEVKELLEIYNRYLESSPK